jgi:hypothetical protein
MTAAVPVITCLTLLLAGCVAVPVRVTHNAGAEAGSRANIADVTPTTIVTGQTTRVQVLMSLGEPDGRAADDSWFLYESVANRGGGQWLAVGVEGLGGHGGAMPLGNWDISSRLIVKFSVEGTVSNVAWQRKECNQWGGTGDFGISQAQGDCPDPRGSDLALVDAKSHAFASVGTIVSQYSNYWFLQSKPPNCKFPGLLFSTPHQGQSFSIGELGIIWQEATGGWRVISFKDVQYVRPLEEHGLGKWLLPIETRDGSCMFLAVSNGILVQKSVQEEARIWILKGTDGLKSSSIESTTK